MRFTFTGELSLTDKDGNIAIREGVTKSKKGKEGSPYKALNLTVAAAKNNRGYAEIFGMKRATINATNMTGDAIEVDWEDRLDADVIKTVNSMNKYVVVDGDERHEFLTEWDLIQYLVDNADEIGGRRATVTGAVKKNEYNGKISNRFVFNSVYLLDEDDERKNSLRLRGEMYFNKDSIDTADWASEKKLSVSAYTREYAGKADDGTVKYAYYEQPFIYDCSKVDFDNELMTKKVKFILRQLGCELVDQDKVKATIKKGWVVNSLVLAYANGAEEVELTYDELTETQKEMVDLGMKEVSDFKPAGGSYGERKVVYKVVNFDAKGNYEDGLVALDTETCDEIEDNIYVPTPVTEKAAELDEEVEEKPKKATKAAPVEEDDEDLFA